MGMPTINTLYCRGGSEWRRWLNGAVGFNVRRFDDLRDDLSDAVGGCDILAYTPSDDGRTAWIVMPAPTVMLDQADYRWLIIATTYQIEDGWVVLGWWTTQQNDGDDLAEMVEALAFVLANR